MTQAGDIQQRTLQVPVAGGHAAPARSLRPRRRVRPHRSQFAVKASEGVVVLPRVKALGYLTKARLFRLAHAGDQSAMQALWLAHARLAYSVVNRIRVRSQHVPDALQASQVGLARAIAKFEVERLNEFSTYAYHWLRQGVHRYRDAACSFIPIPAHLIQEYHAYRHKVAEAASAADWFDARAEMLDRCADQYHTLVRIHTLAEPATLTPKAALADNDLSPLARLLTQELNERIHDALGTLDDRERQVIRHRFGLDGLPEQTLEEVGQHFKLTRERVRQIQAKAEEKLRTPLASFDPACSTSTRPNHNPQRLSSTLIESSAVRTTHP